MPSTSDGLPAMGAVNWIGLKTLYMREVRRFIKVYTQTLVAPLVTTMRFLAVFALALGGDHRVVAGMPFMTFLAPGLIMMAIAQNAFANTSSSLMIGKIQGNIVDSLMAPLNAHELTFGFAIGGMTRGVAVAVVVGVIVSALAYAWNNATRIHAKTHETPEGGKVYQIEGPLFFGSTDGFDELFKPATDPGLVIIDFMNSRVVDHSALQAIEALAQKYEAQGKTLQLRHLSRDCHQLLSRAGQLMLDSDDDPNYGIAVDYFVKTGSLGGGH
ncbi:MAG: ABC transporter permease [Rhodospirillales bacterium]